MANTKGRVLISKNPEVSLKLAKKVFDKHVADGSKSELNNLDETKYDWAKTGPTIAPCLAYHDQAEKLKAQMENAYRLRDELLAPINFHVAGSKTYLKGKYNQSPKKLGDWGFEIDDTPKASKKKP